ncbi:MAG: hypothetical protein RR877_00675 [Aurantimicrobium sp.]|uniref:hypothetical protein n=1 Tax=Aurantimicrobium sp. TaxID=1930784 RepID=UPI002FC7E596
MSTLFSPTNEGTLAAGSVLSTVMDTYNKALAVGSHMKTSSLVSATSVARVEPIVIVDKDCLFLEYLPDILQSTQSIFVGYWLQALSLITNVGDVNVGRVLDKLNPNRKVDTNGFLETIVNAGIGKENYTYASESMKYKLPTIAMEAKGDKGDKDGAIAKVDNVAELANLSIGKLINVTIKNNGQEAVIPISFRLMVNTLPPASCVQLLSQGSVDLSFSERWFKWRAGRISFIKDLVFCQDLIREQKRTLMTDKDGVYSEIAKRAKNSKLASFFSKNPSLAEASNIVIISEETAMQLRVKHNLNLDNYKDRQKIFDKTYAMILVVIDRNYERVNMYHYGISTSTSVGLRDIKAANKSSGPNIMEALAAFKGGNAPVF